MGTEIKLIWKTILLWKHPHDAKYESESASIGKVSDSPYTQGERKYVNVMNLSTHGSVS